MADPEESKRLSLEHLTDMNAGTTDLPRSLRLMAAALDAGLKRNHGPTHPQAGKFTPEFLASVAVRLTEAARALEAG